MGAEVLLVLASLIVAHKERPIDEFHCSPFRLGLRGTCSMPQYDVGVMAGGCW
jgi:hypothetical protein